MGDEPAYSDFELLDRWAGGDLAAGNELFERHFDQVYRFFEHKARSDAADLVQRTFLACVEGTHASDALRAFAPICMVLLAMS